MADTTDTAPDIAELIEQATKAHKEAMLSSGYAKASVWASIYGLKLLSALTALSARIAELEAERQHPVIEEIRAERERQMSAERWTPEHDDRYTQSQLALAGACYALSASGLGDESKFIHGRWETPIDWYWPWHRSFWKPKDRRRDLIRAAALIVAEIERLDHAAAQPPAEEAK